MTLLLRSLSLVLAACTALGSPAAGASPATTEVVRPVEPFVAVALRAPVDLVLRQGTKESLTVQAAEAVQPLVETAVVDGSAGRTLEVRLRKGSRLPMGASVVVSVDVATLRALLLSGSGDVRASGLRGESLDVSISGSGDLDLAGLQVGTLALRIAGSGDARLSGRAGKFTSSIAGSGDVDAEALDAGDVAVRVAGSGDYRLGSASSLDISIAGSGDVSYLGDPRLTQRIAGSGSVTRR